MSSLSFLSVASEHSADLLNIEDELSLQSTHIGGCHCATCSSSDRHGHNHSHSHTYSHSHSHSQQGFTTAQAATQMLLVDILNRSPEATSPLASSEDSYRFKAISAAIESYASATSATFDGSVFNRIAGVPDDAAAFATMGRDGSRIENGRTFGASPLKWTSSDGKSDGRGATVVTYAFDDDFKIDGVSSSQARGLFEEALQIWAKHAPIDFKEFKDPGRGSDVDIYVQSDEIDGRSGTLAFAYFPSVGDITFDTGELWNDSMFLETTVHELGHSLGLDHEDGKDANGQDIEAIMNSVLGNRFRDQPAFLFQDDINGINSLYGKGEGSVTRLDGTVVSTKDTSEQPDDDSSIAFLPIVNLVTNGSFEDVPLEVGEFEEYGAVTGWSMISGAGFQVDRRPDSHGKAADGTAWVELDVFGQNATIGQNIDTVTGQTYNVSVDFSNGGRPESTTSIQVFWEGRQVDTLSGGGKGEWRRFDYELKGGDRTVSTLAFRAIGPSDKVGGFIDNIVVSEARASAAASGDSGQKVLGVSPQPEVYRDLISGDRNSLMADTSLFNQCAHSASTSFV